MNTELAVKLADSKWWVGLSPEIIVGFQLFEPLLCTDYYVFKEALDAVFKRTISDYELTQAPKGIKQAFLENHKEITLIELIYITKDNKELLANIIKCLDNY